jgi:hypothetical protein
MLCKYNFRCYRGTQGNQTSHFQKRGKETVRFDPDNCDWVCGKCHYFVENDPQGQKTLEEWKRKQLGEKRYNSLLIRANQTGKKDDAMAIIYIKQLMNELNGLERTI